MTSACCHWHRLDRTSRSVSCNITKACRLNTVTLRVVPQPVFDRRLEVMPPDEFVDRVQAHANAYKQLKLTGNKSALMEHFDNVQQEWVRDMLLAII